MRANPETRFWSKVDRGDDGCWTWKGARFQRGRGATRILTYGMFSVGEALIPAHRYSWAITNGPIPAGLWVLHRCDNPPCVRPDHLFLGTAQDNSDDMKRKGRQPRGNPNPARGDRNAMRLYPERRPRGEANGWAVLDATRVRQIRARLDAGASHASIACDFAISKATVGKIARRETWQHVA